MTKLVGIIGGVSWESTVLYYKLINQAMRERFGGLNSARLLIYSLNYDPIVAFEREENWQAVSDILVSTAKNLEKAGAEFLILGCNTLHKVADAIEGAIKIPFLHIADAVGDASQKANIKTVALLGTQFTMEDGFYANRLEDKYHVKVLTPPEDRRKLMDDIIYQELCVGKLLESSREKIAEIMKSLVGSGAEAIILGCTELGMLVQAEDVSVPVFDSTILHVDKTVAMSLS
jgi:aspartate racemase